MPEILQTLLQLGELLLRLAGEVLQYLLTWSLLIAWLAWWLWGVNWRRAWSVLAEGAWVPVVLLIVVSALVWSQMAPGDFTGFGFLTVPNFWWQLGAVALLAAVALFCGWLQGVFGWTPAEISLEPPAPPPGLHAHGNGHAHH